MNSFYSLRNLSLGAIFFIRRDSFLLPTRGVEVFGDLWKIAHTASFCRKSKTLPNSKSTTTRSMSFSRIHWISSLLLDVVCTWFDGPVRRSEIDLLNSLSLLAMIVFMTNPF